MAERSNSELSTKVRGVVPPMATPLDANGAIDEAGVSRLVERMAGAGVDGLFPLGTTGEAPHLGRDLRAGFLRLVCRAVAGRVPVLAGITDSSVAEAAWMAERAAEAGAAAVVFAAPHYFPMTQPELVGYARALARRLPLPFIVYNIPFCTRDFFEVDTVKRIAEIPGCIGIKDSTGDLAMFAQLVDAFKDRDDFTVLMGPEELLFEAVTMGGDGGVTGGANLAPELFTGIYAAALQGDEVAAAPLRARAEILREGVYGVVEERSGYLRGLKTALDLLGICGPTMAEPFETLTGEPREKIRAALIEAGLL